MTEEKLEKIYKKVRVIIFAIPGIVVLTGLYLVLFPVDSYRYYPDNSKSSKFEISKDEPSNSLFFGVFPTRAYRYIGLSLDLKKNEKKSCQPSEAEISLNRTFRAFLYPDGDLIENEQQFQNFLFDSNKTKYPNGSLLHLKPTNHVFLISRGKKILFPAPEIFTAFGYNFENIIEVEQSEIDQFPNAENRFFSWLTAHPDGTVFQAFPSHSLFLVFDGKKYPIASKELMERVWPENFTIPVSDYDPGENLNCSVEENAENIKCYFDSSLFDDIGRYHSFTVKFPKQCGIKNIYPKKARISFFSEKSFSTMEDSLRTIAASILNRYFYEQ